MIPRSTGLGPTRHRVVLLSSVALGLLVAPLAEAQVAVAPPNAFDVPVLAPTPGSDGGASVTTPSSGQVAVDILGSDRLMKWSSFNVGGSARVSFGDSTNAAGTFSVLNLVDAASGLSQIYGQIVADPKITVWLSNPSGILFGAGGSFSGGSLVLTTQQMSLTDQARFDGRIAGRAPLTGTVRLDDSVDTANGVTPGSVQLLGGSLVEFTGRVILSAQAVDVRGILRPRSDVTGSVPGDIALLAAKTVEIPVSVGSPLTVRIVEGTTLGTLQVRSDSGQPAAALTGGHIVLAGASGASTTELLLNVAPDTALTAVATDGASGRVALYAGTATANDDGVTIDPAPVGSNRIASDAVIAAAGGVRIEAAGAISGTVGAIGAGNAFGATTRDIAMISGGSVAFAAPLRAGGLVNVSGAGDVTLGGTIDAADGVTLTAGGDLDVANTIHGGSGSVNAAVSLTAGGGMVLGTAGAPHIIDAGGDVSLRALNGAIATRGPLTVQSGLAPAHTGSVIVSQAGTGGIQLADATLLGGTETVAGAGYTGGVRVDRVAGNLALGRVEAATFTMPVATGDVRIGTIDTINALDIRTSGGALRLNTVRSRTGDVTLDASGDISGLATATIGDARLLDGFGRTDVAASGSGRTIAITSGGTAQLGTLTASNAGAAATAAAGLTVTARAIDLNTATAFTGALTLGDAATREVRVGTATATTGALTVNAIDTVRGQPAAGALTAVADGLRVALLSTGGDVAIDTLGNARLGSITAGGGLSVGANGSVTGLARTAVAPNVGAVLTAGGAITVGSDAQRPVTAALGVVTAGGATTIYGDRVSAADIRTPGALRIVAGGGLSLDAAAAGNAALSSTGTGGEDPSAVLYADNAILSPNYGAARLTATNLLQLRAGRDPAASGGIGIAQLDAIRGGSADVIARALTVDHATTLTGELALRATQGAFYLGNGDSAGSATLTKSGRVGIAVQDELRVADTLLARTGITVVSAGVIRANTMRTASGDLLVRASDAVTGVSPATAAAGLAIGSADVGGRLTVVTGGHARLGTLRSAGDMDVVAAGSVTGLAPGFATPAGANLFAGGAVDVRTDQPGGSPRLGVATLGTVQAGTTATVIADAVSIGSIGARAVSLDATRSLQVGSLAASGDASLRAPNAGDGEDPAVRFWSTDAILSPNVGAANLLAGGALSVTTGPAGVAQLQTIRGRSISVGAQALTLDSATATEGMALTARAGGLYLGSGAAGGAARLIKQGTADGGVIDDGANEIRVVRGLTAGGGISVNSATGVRANRFVASGGDIAISAARNVTGLVRGTALLDGRIDALHDRLDLSASEPAARIGVVAGQTVQLGEMLAGTGAGIDATLIQNDVRGRAIDITRAVATNGNLALTAGVGGIRLGSGDAGWAVARYDGVGGYTAGLASGGDAQVGSLRARGGDLLLSVPGTLSGLLGTGEVAGLAADGLTFGRITTTGDAQLTGAGNVRLGSLDAGGAVTIGAGLSVTGLSDGGLPVRIGADLRADNGAIRLPASADGVVGVAAVLGTVIADRGAVTLRAGNLSANSVRAGGAAALSGNTALAINALDVASLVGRTTSVGTDTDASGLVADGAGRLASGFGFADIATRSTSQSIDIQAVRAAQLGAVIAGGLPGAQSGQRINVAAAAISAGQAASANGVITVTANGGDLQIGRPTTIVDPFVRVASAAGSATLVKSGSAGRVRINGSLEAGGAVSITSATAIEGRAIRSGADASLTAATYVGGLRPEADAGDGIRLGRGTIGTAATITGIGDVAIGILDAGTPIAVSAGGSVTGLLTTDVPVANSFDITATRTIDIRGVQDGPRLEQVRLNQASAGQGVTINADRIAANVVAAGGEARLNAGAGLSLNTLNARTGTLTTDRATGVAAFELAVIDDGTIAAETVVAGRGAATLRTNGGVRVVAGNAAQLDMVKAGDSIDVRAAVASIASANAAAGSLGIAANGGGLYLSNGLAGTAATLTKTGASGDTITKNELRVGTLVGGTSAALRSDTDIRAVSVTANGLNAAPADAALIVTASGGDISGLITANGKALLSGYGRASLEASADAARIAATASGTAQLGSVGAGLGNGATIGSVQVDITANAIDATSVAARNGALALTSRTGQLTLTNGTAGTKALLDKRGSNGELSASTLTAGTSVALTSATNVRAGTITAKGRSADATVADLTVTASGGDVSGLAGTTSGLLPGYARANLEASADAARVAVSASGTAQLGTVGAGRAGGSAIAASAPAQVDVTASAIDASSVDARNGALRLVARAGQLTLTNGTTATAAMLSKAGTSGELSAATLTAGTSVTLTSATNVRAGTITAKGRSGDATAADLTVTASGGDVSGLVGTTSGLLPGYARANLEASADAARIAVSASGTAQLGTVGAGRAGGSAIAASAPAQVDVTASAIDASSVDARNGALRLVSRAGQLTLTNGTTATAAMLSKAGTSGELSAAALTAGTSVTLTSATNVRAGTITAKGRSGDATAADLTVTASGGDVSGLVGTTSGLLPGYARANLEASADAARIAVSASGTAQLGTVGAGRTGGATIAANGPVQVDVTASAIDASSVNARNGALKLTAGSGQLTLTNGTAATAATLSKAGTRGELSAATLAAGTSVTVTSATNVRAGTITANGFNADPSQAAISLKAANGDVSGLAATAGGSLLPGYARANLEASADAARVVVDATGTAQLGTVGAGRTGGSTIAADGPAQVVVSADAIDATAVTTRNGALALTARAGQMTLGTVTAYTTADFIKTGAIGDVAIAGGLNAKNQATIASQTDLDLGGIVDAPTVQVRNTGSGAMLLGGSAGGSGDGNAAFALSAAEVNLLRGSVTILDAGANAVTIGTLPVGDATGSSALRIRTTGAVVLNGALTGAGAPTRVLQIGGSSSDPIIQNGIAQPANLARTIDARLETGAGITWAGVVDLSGNRILFGDAPLRDLVSGIGAGNVADQVVANANSLLYRSSQAGRTFLTANRLQVRYGDYALFQNSGVNAAQSAGVAIGPAGNSTDTLALELYSTGDRQANAFGLFGTINGFVGRSAGLLPEAVLQFATTGSPRIVRITQSNARVNGCVIGSPDRGCLNIDVPPPVPRLFDERQVQLFGTSENPDLVFEPLIGTNNEGLIGDLATAPLDTATRASCPTGSEATCPKIQEKRP